MKNKNRKNTYRVYLVTGVHNDWKHTKKFLKCADIQTYKNLAIIVVDDGSTDDTYGKIVDNYPNVKVLKGDGSLWWTGCLFTAVSEVLKTANNDDYLLTVNNDCTFGQDYVAKILNASRENPDCIIGSLGIDSRDKKTIIDSGAKIEWVRGRISSAGFHKLSDIPKGYRYDSNVDTLTTRGTLYPISVINNVGNFDNKHFPHYASDFEYACRAKKQGVGLVIANDCKVYIDKQRTGSSGPKDKPISFSELRNMLYGRKSQINIVDHFYFIFLCCPWYLQPLNYLYLVAKFIYLSSFLHTFFPLRKPIVKLRSILLSGDK